MCHNTVMLMGRESREEDWADVEKILGPLPEMLKKTRMSAMHVHDKETLDLKANFIPLDDFIDKHLGRKDKE